MKQLLVLLALVIATFANANASNPNIVFIIADDLGPEDTSFMGNPDVRTPALGRLAAQSAVFENAYVTSPSCAPSRGSLLSGLMPYRNGAEPNHSYVRDDVKQLPHYFKELGYETASIGKFTHGDDARAGFDHDDRSLSFEKRHLVSDYLLQRDSNKPLLLMVGIKDPHVPWPSEPFDHYELNQLQVPPQLIDTPETRFELGRYYSDIERMDAQIEATLDAISQHLENETIIFFTSDHGAQLPFGKWNNYEYSVRAPLLVSWPETVQPQRRYDALISFVDLLPTLLEIAGGTPPSSGYGENEIDGRSFLPLLKGETRSHRNYVFSTNSSAAHHTYPLRSVRDERFRYVRNVYPELAFTSQTDHNPKSDSHVMWQAWVKEAKKDPFAAEKLRRYHHRPAEELYDLHADPAEQTNLVFDSRYAAKLRELRDVTNTWIQNSGDTLEKHGKPMDVLVPVP